MAKLFEVTGEDISRLHDDDLRTLIGLLCEADYRLAGLSAKGILWGGHQDAKDGGLDVVVRDVVTPPLNSFVLKSVTGFQVKKPDMPRAQILKEMKPNGILREEIKSLIKEGGAYIIVSSGDSTSDLALRNRINAMREAVVNEDNHQNVFLEFYDRGRIATWVRSHPSMILWVRNKIGRQLCGWHPYNNWANAPEGVDEEYIMDDGLRLHDGNNPTDNGLSAKDGIFRLRDSLSVPRTSIRLAGLSGVGKTRLVQALFDERIAEKALNRSQAFYTDMSYSPDPDPCTFADQFIANKTRAILIVDNCPPELHRRLTKICSEPQSTVSLLTVEYDVREDLPDETSVFRLEPASEEIVEKLIMKRFPHISQVEARAIANVSGGNPRVAIALANTVRVGETLSGFRDEELFERLFRQRHDESESLRMSAEVFSLVYSFEGTDINSDDSELNILASLIGKQGKDIYRDIATLKERDLIQSRNVWRAMLPHAIANRFAKKSLESIPIDILNRVFLSGRSNRLLKSFTRRLNYLHDCKPAVDMVNEWLSNDGWIGKLNCIFNNLGMEIFSNIAPVSPEKALEAIERAANGIDGSSFCSRDNKYFNGFIDILRHIAYDPDLFDRCVNIMCRFALSEKPGENVNSIREATKSLFYIHLSGTHASVETRAKVIEKLLDSDDQSCQELGLLFLDSALESWHFSSYHVFNFGVRPRNYGYSPRTREDLIHWYKLFIDICTRIAISDKPIANKVKTIFSNNLRGLWTNIGMYEALEISTRKIQEKKAWNEGWIAVRGIIKYDSKNFNDEINKKLHNLADILKPNDLLQRARAFALSDQNHPFSLEDDLKESEDASSAWRRVEDTTREIGAKVAQDPDTFNALSHELVSTPNARLHSFGKGLADGCGNKLEQWNILRTQFEKTPPEKRELGVFRGFLSSCAESDPEFYRTTLDNLLHDKLLGEWFPLFQITSIIDKRGVERLSEALDLCKSHLQNFQYLAWGRAHESIGDDELADLLKKILSKEGGIHVAIEILNMRFHGDKEKPPKHSKNLIAIARDLLSNFPFQGERKEHHNQDYALAEIARVSLTGHEGISTAEAICLQFRKAINDNIIYTFDYPKLLNTLANTHPIVFLNMYLEKGGIKDDKRRDLYSDTSDRHGNPLDQISDEVIISWCEENPEKRYPLIALAISGFSESKETGEVEWKPMVYSIIEKAPNVSVALDNLIGGIMPRSWSGSLADILQKRSVLLQKLYQHDNVEVRSWARNKYERLQERITQEREWEKRLDRERNESFE